MKNEVRDVSTIVKQHEVVLADQEIDKVTVFTDRAEVVRLVEVEFGVGLNEVRLTNAPSAIDSDGMRVEGKGDASIVEVSLQERYVPPPKKPPTDFAGLKQMRSDVQKLQEEEQSVSKNINRLLNKETVLDNYSQAAMKSLSQWVSHTDSQTQPDLAFMLNGDTIQTLTKFMDSVHTTNASIDDEIFAAKAKRGLLKNKSEAVLKQIQELEVTTPGRGTQRQDIVVLVDAHTAGKVQLRVSYVVRGANWSVSYDVRASSVDAAVQIHYYAMVLQASGEQWNNAQLVLSTAKPTVSGKLPQLSARFVDFVKPVQRRPQVQHVVLQHHESWGENMYREKSSSSFKKCSSRSARSSTARGTSFDASDAESTGTPEMTYGSATVSTDQFNTAFVVARRSTIPSDKTARKVTIGIINVEADLVHKIVPRKSASAFITAKIRNTSNMTLLAGPSNIFMDNTFVAKAMMDNVGPDENFVCSLGVDPAVRVEYKPMKKCLAQSSGLFSSAFEREVFEQHTEIVNGRQNKIHLLMEDQLPKSKAEKIEVSLLEPQVSADQQTAATGAVVSLGNTKMTVKVTGKSAVEWDLYVEPKEKLDVPFKYQLDYPKDSKVAEYEG